MLEATTEATNLTKTIDVSEAQLHFNEILSLAVEGAEIILTEDNKPVARLVAFVASDAPSTSRVAGLHNGAIGPVMILTNLCQTNSGLVLIESPTGYSRLHLVRF